MEINNIDFNENIKHYSHQQELLMTYVFDSRRIDKKEKNEKDIQLWAWPSDD